MQLSLFDTLNIYKDFIIDDPNISWKPSKKLDHADIIYYKKTPIFHVYIRPSSIKDRWHFQTTSMSRNSGAGYLTDNPARDLNKTIQMWLKKMEETK